MRHNDLKKHTVKVGNGSGCLFQAMDEGFTYILTAKHLLQEENEDNANRTYVENGSDIAISFLSFNGESWTSDELLFIVELNENFFPHPNYDVDAAILKIPFRENYENIHINKKVVGRDFFLCGYPGRLVNEAEIGGDYSYYSVEEFGQSGNYFNVAKLNSIIGYDEVSGTSGGGLLAFDESHISITGIQSRMSTQADFALGEIGYVPIKYFEQIIDENRDNGKLQDLIPAFLKSFVSLIGNTFQMASGPLHIEEEVMSELLSAKAELLRNSSITPLGLKAFIGDKRLLITNQDSVELKKKKVWIFWLELLVILNIAKEKVHNIEDLETLLKKIRFFYSDTDNDFLSEHLQDLWKIDYTDLEDGGLVVFSSNQRYQSEKGKGLLDLCEILPNIASARREYMKHQNQLIGAEGINIVETTKFPFERFKYASISLFKEEAALELNCDFVNMNPDDCYPLLKQLYERLLP